MIRLWKKGVKNYMVVETFISTTYFKRGVFHGFKY